MLIYWLFSAYFPLPPQPLKWLVDIPVLPVRYQALSALIHSCLYLDKLKYSLTKPSELSAASLLFPLYKPVPFVKYGPQLPPAGQN